MEMFQVKEHNHACGRCGSITDLGAIGLCRTCETAVDEEYAMMYNLEESMEIIAE